MLWWSVYWCKCDVKSPTIIVLLSISSFISVSICFMYLDAAKLGLKYICDYCMFLDLALDHWMSLSLVTFFILKLILSYVGIANPGFFWFPFAMNTFFYPFIFATCVSSKLKWNSYGQYRVVSYFPIYSVPLSFENVYLLNRTT